MGVEVGFLAGIPVGTVESCFGDPLKVYPFCSKGIPSGTYRYTLRMSKNKGLQKMNLKDLEYLATAFSIFGGVLNALLLWHGFVVWIMGNIIWIYIGNKKEMNGMIITFIVFTFTAILGLYIWEIA